LRRGERGRERKREEDPKIAGLWIGLGVPDLGRLRWVKAYHDSFLSKIPTNTTSSLGEIRLHVVDGGLFSRGVSPRPGDFRFMLAYVYVCHHNEEADSSKRLANLGSNELVLNPRGEEERHTQPLSFLEVYRGSPQSLKDEW